MAVNETFWFCMGALVAAALAFVVPLLWRSLSATRRSLRYATLAAFIGAFTLGSLWMYEELGTPPSRDPASAHRMDAGETARPADSLLEATRKLADRLRSQGGSDAEWELLAASYESAGDAAAAAAARDHRVANTAPANAAAETWSAQAEQARRERRFDAAKAAFEQGIERDEMTADTWADYADALAAQAGSLQGAPVAAIEKALQLDPQHRKALWLRASLAIEARRYADALADWRRLRAAIPDESPDARIVDANIEEARALAKEPAKPAAANRGAMVSGEVAIDPALAARLQPGFTLFIYAKAADRPGPPLAVIRRPATGFPVRFSLDDSHAMMPDRRLSAFDRVIVEARVSASGDAASKSGDLAAPGTLVDPHRSPTIKLTLSKVIG